MRYLIERTEDDGTVTVVGVGAEPNETARDDAGRPLSYRLVDESEAIEYCNPTISQNVGLETRLVQIEERIKSLEERQ